MSPMSLPELAAKMRDLDFAMLITHRADGSVAARPMSNNRQVDYQGTSWFFTLEESLTVAEIERDPKVALTLQGPKGLFGGLPIFIAIEGVAELVRNRERFEEHWVPDLDAWFIKGIDTPGLVLLKVRATRLQYWDGESEGEVPLPG